MISQDRNIHFAFVGEGAYREQYMRQAAELGLEEHGTWTGQIDDPMTEGVYAAADVICQVSRWEEVFGYVIAEAMSCSKPLVATRVGGIPELVEDGRTGFVVDRGDVPAIADRILELAADRALRERMGRACRQAVEVKFDLERNVARVLESYRISAPAHEDYSYSPPALQSRRHPTTTNPLSRRLPVSRANHPPRQSPWAPCKRARQAEPSPVRVRRSL